MIKNCAIILASGTGSRYGSELPKQFVKIADKTILEHTIEVFEKNSLIDEIFVVITPEYRNLAQEILSKNNYRKVFKLLNGGKTRKDSSFIGIDAINEIEANVLIHDCARPFLNQKIIDNCIESLKIHKAVAVAVASTDTIFEVDNNNLIKNIPNRTSLKCAQTPQGFKLSVIKKAHELSQNDVTFTDDCGLVIKYNLADICIVEGDITNFKITYPSDIYMAEHLLKNN